MKPPEARLDPATYPFATEIAPRFGDMDALGHLNNVAIAGLYEEGRIRFSASLHQAFHGTSRPRTVVAALNIRYVAEGHYPGIVSISAGVLKLGRASYTLVQAMFQGGRCIGTCDTVVVHTADGRPYPIPALFRADLAGAAWTGPSEQGGNGG